MDVHGSATLKGRLVVITRVARGTTRAYAPAFFAARVDAIHASTIENSSKAAPATISFYLADDMKHHNVAVNVLVPGHTRTTGSTNKTSRVNVGGAHVGPQPLVPEHMVPIARTWRRKTKRSFR